MKNGTIPTADRIAQPFAGVPDVDAAHCAPGLADLLRQTADFLADYIAFPLDAHAPTVALWIAHTWAFEAFDFTPYLNINSPLKRCGKSTLLEAIKLLARRPWGPVVSPSPAVLFRKIQADCPTLLLDEVDTIFSPTRGEEGKEDVRAVLNGGFQRGATVPRCVGPTHALAEFSVFCPKALSGIGTLPDTVADRSLVVTLARRPPGTKGRRFRFRAVAPQADALRQGWQAWAEAPATVPTLRDARPPLPETMGDRQADICEPLLSIADLAAGEWPTLARKSLGELFGAPGATDENLNAKLLADIRDAFTEAGESTLSTRALLGVLIERDDSPWAQWWEPEFEKGNVKGPASRLARLLRPFNIRSRKVRTPGASPLMSYSREDFEEAFASYLPPETTQKDGTTEH